MDGFWAGLLLTAIVAGTIPHPNTWPDEIAWAESVCRANGGLKKMRSSGRLILPTKATCKNSAVFKKDESAPKPPNAAVKPRAGVGLNELLPITNQRTEHALAAD